MKHTLTFDNDASSRVLNMIAANSMLSLLLARAASLGTCNRPGG
jgi:hypothetical protein